MKEKMWFLMVDSILQAHAGAWEIMDNATNISMQCYCELTGCNLDWLKSEVERIKREAWDTINHRIENQALLIELIELELSKLKTKIDAVIK